MVELLVYTLHPGKKYFPHWIEVYCDIAFWGDGSMIAHTSCQLVCCDVLYCWTDICLHDFVSGFEFYYEHSLAIQRRQTFLKLGPFPTAKLFFNQAHFWH